MDSAILRSQQINAAAFCTVKRLLRIGMTERQIARLVHRVLRAEGAEKLAFPTIAALGRHAAIPHHIPTARRARRGDLLVLDMGCVVNGMRSDMTRTLFFGEIKSQHRLWYNLVFEAQQRGLRAVRASRTGKEVDAVVRNFLTRKGVGEYFIHSLGHGVGRAIHQPPWISPRKGIMTLRVGDIITIEPGLYFKGRGGVRIEDMCEVREGGAHWLTPMSRHISKMIIKEKPA